MTRRPGLPALLLLCLAAGACGKEAPKADAAVDRKEALERAKSGAFGTQVQALEAAKGLEADLDRKAREAVEKAEQGSK